MPLKIILMILLSNAGQIIIIIIIQTPITHNVLPAYPNPKRNNEDKYTYTNNEDSKIEGSTFTQSKSLGVLKLTKRERNNKVRKQVRKK